MNPAETVHAALALVSSHPLLGRLFFASLEFAGLALAVAMAIHIGRVRSPRLISVLWLLVLAKPIVSLAIGSPLPIVRLEASATEATSGPALAGSEPLSTAWSSEGPSPTLEGSNRRTWSDFPWMTNQVPSAIEEDRSTATEPSKAADVPRAEGHSSILGPANIVCAGWLVGVVFFAFRSVLDRLRLRKLIMGACAPGSELCARYDTILSRFGLKHAPALLVTDDLESPALARLMSPVILVPSWLVRDEDQTKMDWALRHELTHWRLLDPLASLVRELAQVLFYFHPAAWWVGKKWEEGMELACDRAIVSTEADLQEYAERLYRMLVEIRGRRRLPVSSGLFATRTQIGRRIAALLNGPLESSARLSSFAILCVATLSTVTLTVGGGFAVAPPQADDKVDFKPNPTDAENSKESQDADPGASIAAASTTGGRVGENSTAKPTDVPPPVNDVIVVGGHVLSPTGRPLAGARIYTPHLDRQPSASLENVELVERGVSGLDGSFRLEIPLLDLYHHPATGKFALVASAPGFGLSWVELRADERANALILRLVEDEPVRGHVIDTDGQPVTALAVQVKGLLASSSGTLDGLLTAWRREWQSATQHCDLQLFAPLGKLLHVTVAADGHFEIRGIGKERLALVQVSGVHVTQNVLYVVARGGIDVAPFNEAVDRWMPANLDISDRPRLVGPTLDLVFEPTKPIEGTVRESNGGPIAGAHVSSVAGYSSYVISVTDALGRFRLVGLPKRKEYSVYVSPGDDRPLLGRLLRVPDTAGLEPIRTMIELPRGVVVSGRAIDKATGKGVQSGVRFAPLPDNKYFGTKPGYDTYRYERLMSATDREGFFRLVTIPGPGVLLVQAYGSNDPMSDGVSLCPYREAEFDTEDRQRVALSQDGRSFPAASGSLESLGGYHALRVLDLDPNVEAVKFDLFLDRGRTVEVNVEDPSGKPLSGTVVAGITESWPKTIRVKGSRFVVYALDAKKPRQLLLYHPDRNLAGRLLVRGDETERPTVRLSPTNTLTGRAVDTDGQALTGAEVRLSIADDTAFELYRQLEQQRDAIRTDRDGKFRMEGVIPGLLFELTFRHEGKVFVADQLWDTVRAVAATSLGSAGRVDLGELKVKPRE